MNKSLLSAALAALALAAPVAHAHQAGDVIVRAGAITVAPNESSGDLKFDGSKVSGTKATLDSDTQLGLTFAYMLTDHVGLELLAATPFKHTVGVKGLGGGLDGIDGVRRSWRWLPVAPIALTAALLVKGVFVVLIVVAAAIWAVTNPAREPVRWTRVAAAGLASVVLMAATAIAYDAAYYRVTGQTFWGPYWQRQLAPLTIATPFEGGSMLMVSVSGTAVRL